MVKRSVFVLGTVLALAGCGDTAGEQVLFGGSAGVLGAAATGGDPVAGAAIGAGGNVLFCQAYPERCRR